MSPHALCDYFIIKQTLETLWRNIIKQKRMAFDGNMEW